MTPVIEIEPVSEGIQSAIDLAAPMLSKSVARDEQSATFDDLTKDLLDGSAMLFLVWVNGDAVAAFVARVISYPRRKTLYIQHMGGKDLNVWMPYALQVLRHAAKERKLHAIEADGRIGFARMAAKNGFRETHRHFEMEI